MLGLAGEPLLGELLLGEPLPTPLNMLVRFQLVSWSLQSRLGRWLSAPVCWDGMTRLSEERLAMR